MYGITLERDLIIFFNDVLSHCVLRDVLVYMNFLYYSFSSNYLYTTTEIKQSIIDRNRCPEQR